MALADELLDSISEEQFAEYMLVEENPHIVIDEDRNIILPERYKIIAAQGDHDMTTYTFDCPRFSDGRDMSKMVVYINYIRSDGETGSYPADNVSIDAQNNDLMHFEWKPLLPATIEHGAFAFLVCVCRTEPDGSVKNHWSTRLCKDATISEGMDCHKDTIINMYPDVITRILERLNVLEDGGTTSVQYTVQDLEEEQKVQARKNIEAADAKEVSKLSEDIANKGSAIVDSASGETIVLTDSDRKTFRGMNVYGKSTQDGMPTIDAPIEIVDCENTEVGVYTKNFLQNIALSQTRNGVEFTVNSDGTVIANGTATSDTTLELQYKNPVLPKGKLILNGCPSGGNYDRYFIEYSNYEDNSYKDHGNGVELECFNYDRYQNCHINIWILSGATVNNLIFKPMISIEGGEYEQYKPKQSLPIPYPLRGLEVTDASIANYTDSDGKMWCADYVDYEAKEHVQRIWRGRPTKNIVFTEQNTNTTSGAYGRCFVWDNTLFGVEAVSCGRYSTQGMCTHCINNKFASINGTFAVSEYSLYYKDDTKTLDEINTMFAEIGTDIEFEIILGTPIRTPLTESELSAYKALYTNYPTTTIFSDCNVGMNVSYVADTKAYIDKKFAELATAMV